LSQVTLLQIFIYGHYGWLKYKNVRHARRPGHIKSAADVNAPKKIPNKSIRQNKSIN